MLHKSSAFIENRVDLQNSLKQIGKKFRSVNKNPFDSISSFDFKIFTENITYVYSPKDTTETYSFYIEKDFKRNSFIIENLILKKGIKEKIYKAYIIKYFLKNGLTNPEENMQVTSFEEIDINNIQGISKTCTGSYEYIVLETKHDCYSGDHSGANQEGKCDYIADGGSPPYSTWSVVVLQNGCDGGGGGGTVEPTDPDSGDPTGPGGSPTGPGGGDSGVDTGMSLPPSCQTTDCAEEDILANQINEKLNSSLSYEELIWLFDNNSQAQRIDNFLDANSRNLHAKNFARALIFGKITNDYEMLFEHNLFVQDPYNAWKDLTQAEKDRIIDFPYDAWAIWNNRPIAVQATISKFGFSRRNDKSDAFRHAYFNAINTMDVGSYFAEIFSTAHESENPSHLILEKQMDLFNNSIGHDAQINYPNHSDSQLVNDIYQELLDGNLRYLSPLDPVVYPNFGINSQTRLIPTNQ